MMLFYMLIFFLKNISCKSHRQSTNWLDWSKRFVTLRKSGHWTQIHWLIDMNMDVHCKIWLGDIIA